MKTTFEWWLQTTDHDDSAGDASEGSCYVGLVLDVQPVHLVGPGTDIPPDTDGSMAEMADSIRQIPGQVAHFVVTLWNDGSVDYDRFLDRHEASDAFAVAAADLDRE